MRGRAGAEVLLTALFLALGGVAGVAVLYVGWVALLVPLVPFVAYHTVKDPTKGLVFLAAFVALENAVVIPGVGTGAKIAGLTVAAAWIVGKVGRRESWRALAESPVIRLSLCLLALVLASMLWAAEPTLTRSGFIQLAQLVMLGIIVFDTCRDLRGIEALAKALVVGGVIAASLTIAEYLSAGVRRAGDSAAGINGTAELLVTLLPLAFYFILGHAGRMWQWIGLMALFAAVGAVTVTFSRMSVLALPIVISVLALGSLRTARGRRWVVPILGAILLAGATMVPWEGLANRAKTIMPYVQATVGSAGESAALMSGRGYHLLVAWRIFEDHPILGVGYENYGWHFLYQYQHSVGGRGALYESFRSPHSSHFGILAELGVVGLSIWLTLLLVTSFGLARALRAARVNAPDSGLVWMGRALLFAFVIQIVPYALYGPNQKSKLLWVLLGLVAACAYALQRLASEREDMGIQGAVPQAKVLPVPG